MHLTTKRRKDQASRDEMKLKRCVKSMNIESTHLCQCCDF